MSEKKQPINMTEVISQMNNFAEEMKARTQELKGSQPNFLKLKHGVFEVQFQSNDLSVQELGGLALDLKSKIENNGTKKTTYTK